MKMSVWESNNYFPVMLQQERRNTERKKNRKDSLSPLLLVCLFRGHQWFGTFVKWWIMCFTEMITQPVSSMQGKINFLIHYHRLALKLTISILYCFHFQILPLYQIIFLHCHCTTIGTKQCFSSVIQQANSYIAVYLGLTGVPTLVFQSDLSCRFSSVSICIVLNEDQDCGTQGEGTSDSSSPHMPSPI